ncbi:DUF3499 domain-containing protein [Cumulibacter manganitolerans]|uniref:DUF3499 domain-containing protein n=1 Tax=Cumulibacter manganitolerans TaxID=1884992 RepID=UPI0012980898|nr:DUF3499 domain-containing protein [Cumulibacter manganitolerans]
MKSVRRCSKPECFRAAVATLTYIYAESTAVVGPLASYSEPHSYDLCEVHASRLTVPRGWEVLRHEVDPTDVGPSTDDLLALADAVREAARPQPELPDMPAPPPSAPQGRGRRGHLRVVPPSG